MQAIMLKYYIICHSNDLHTQFLGETSFLTVFHIFLEIFQSLFWNKNYSENEKKKTPKTSKQININMIIFIPKSHLFSCV